VQEKAKEKGEVQHQTKIRRKARAVDEGPDLGVRIFDKKGTLIKKNSRCVSEDTGKKKGRVGPSWGPSSHLQEKEFMETTWCTRGGKGNPFAIKKKTEGRGRTLRKTSLGRTDFATWRRKKNGRRSGKTVLGGKRKDEGETSWEQSRTERKKRKERRYKKVRSDNDGRLLTSGN